MRAKKKLDATQTKKRTAGVEAKTPARKAKPPRKNVGGALAIRLPALPERTAAVGRGPRVDNADLLGQTLRSIELGKMHADGLARGGFTPARNLALQGALNDFDELHRDYRWQSNARKDRTRALRALLAECNLFRRQLVAGLKIATRGRANPFKRETLKLSRTRTPIQVVMWLSDVLPLLGTHRKALAPRFSSDPAALAKALSARLSAALGVQMVSQKEILARKQQEARQRLADLIAEQRLAAAIAFAGNKAVLAQFVASWDRKRRLNRNRRAGRGDPSADGTGAPPKLEEPKS